MQKYLAVTAKFLLSSLKDSHLICFFFPQGINESDSNGSSPESLKSGNIRIPLPPGYNNSNPESFLNGQPIPPSLRHGFASSKSPVPPLPPPLQRNGTPAASKDEEDPQSPEQLRVRSPQSLHRMAFDIATLRKSDDNQNLDLNENDSSAEENKIVKDDDDFQEDKESLSGATVTA